MSLVPTYIQATNGFFYKDPELSGKTWFVVFDDDDDPELVVSKKDKSRPEEILKSAGIKFSNLQHYDSNSQRIFDKSYSNFKPANSYWFELKGPIDPKFITFHEGKVKEPEGQGVFYRFKF